MSKVGEVLATLDGKFIEGCPSVEHRGPIADRNQIKGSGIIIMRVGTGSWDGTLFEPCVEHGNLEYWNSGIPASSGLRYVLYEGESV